MSTPEPYEIYAIRYGHHDRNSPENFIGGDPHDVLQPLDFYVWAIVGRNGAIILDTGFDATMGKKRQRELIKPVGDGLKAIGIDPAAVETVIVSHMHYDHIGNYELFPRALSPAGSRDGLRHGALHVPHGAAAAVRGRRRGGDGAQGLRRPRRLP